MRLEEAAVLHAVVCVECEAVAAGPAEGWRAYVVGGYDGETPEVVVYCPACDARESGERRG